MANDQFFLQFDQLWISIKVSYALKMILFGERWALHLPVSVRLGIENAARTYRRKVAVVGFPLGYMISPARGSELGL